MLSRISRKLLSPESTNTLLKSWSESSLPRFSHKRWMAGTLESLTFPLCIPTEMSALRAKNSWHISVKKKAIRVLEPHRNRTEHKIILDFHKTHTYPITSLSKSEALHTYSKLFFFFTLNISEGLPSFPSSLLTCLYTLRKTCL